MAMFLITLLLYTGGAMQAKCAMQSLLSPEVCFMPTVDLGI